MFNFCWIAGDHTYLKQSMLNNRSNMPQFLLVNSWCFSYCFQFHANLFFFLPWSYHSNLFVSLATYFLSSVLETLEMHWEISGLQRIVIMINWFLHYVNIGIVICRRLVIFEKAELKLILRASHIDVILMSLYGIRSQSSQWSFA